MKQQLISLFFCGVLLLQGCTEKKNEAQLENTLSVYQVDLKSESPKESIDRFLAGMEIRLLPLESGDSILFKGSASTIHLADDDIFLLDASQRVIFRFGRDGKFKNKIFRNGQGPEEYNVLFNMALFDNKVYALDNTKIQLYDYEGNYLKTVPLKNDGRQVAVAKDGTIAVASNYIQPYQLTLYRPDGTISEYLPSDKNLLKQQISQSTYHSLKRYGDRILLTNYFDPSIYQLEDTVSAFATLDFKGMNIPSDMFSGTDEEIANRFREYREGDKAILSFDRLTVTDDWVVFAPSLIWDPCVVYYNRKSDTYLLNKNWGQPYDLFFGGYRAPDGYDEKSREFYQLVNAVELKEVVGEIAKAAPNYQDTYPFLKGVDVSQIDDNTNDWIVFFKLRS